MSVDYLVLCSIGPVQSFISQARKLHDLYAGSRMLSTFALHVAEWLRNNHTDETDVIFPAPSLDSAPNRVLFRLAAASDAEVRMLCLTCEKDLRMFFDSFAQQQLASALTEL